MKQMPSEWHHPGGEGAFSCLNLVCRKLVLQAIREVSSTFIKNAIGDLFENFVQPSIFASRYTKSLKKRELNSFMPSLGLYGQGSIPDLQGRIRSQTSPAAID